MPVGTLGVHIVVGKFTEVGSNIVAGIKSGILGQWDAMVDWVDGLISGLVDKIKKLLRISSPSGVFAEIGANLMAGMQQGILGSIDLPTLAVTQAVNATVGAASGGVQSGTNYNGGINITINGAGDPKAVAREIATLLKLQGIQTFM